MLPRGNGERSFLDLAFAQDVGANGSRPPMRCTSPPATLSGGQGCQVDSDRPYRPSGRKIAGQPFGVAPPYHEGRCRGHPSLKTPRVVLRLRRPVGRGRGGKGCRRWFEGRLRYFGGRLEGRLEFPKRFVGRPTLPSIETCSLTTEPRVGTRLARFPYKTGYGSEQSRR